MALATTLFPGEPGGALATLLSQGVSALNQAVNNAINVGRDRATIQLNQENTVFSVLKNQRDFDMRKAENLRRNYETDRLFNRSVVRDVRQDFVKDRDFFQDVSQFEQNLTLSKAAGERADAAAKRTSEHYTTREQQAGQELELRAQQQAASLLKLQEEQKQTDLLRKQQTELEERAMGATGNLISDPLQLSTVTTPELENYADLFGPVQTPQVQGRVAAARRELARRNPDVDPTTGRKVPERFAPDRERRAISSMPRSDQVYNASQLQRIIIETEQRLANKDFKAQAKATLLRELAEAEERLSLFPADVQEEARKGGTLSSPSAPGAKPGASYYE